MTIKRILSPKLWLLLLFVFVTHGLLAICIFSPGTLLRAFPQSGSIPKNAWMLLESEMNYVNPFTQKGFKVYLISDVDTVEMKVQEVRNGAAYISQALLKASRTLTAEQVYFMQVSLNDSTDKRVSIRDFKNKRFGLQTWRVDDEIDKGPPVWLNIPEFSHNTCINYGCGPETFAFFSFRLKDKAPVFIKTELLDTETKETQVAYLYLHEENEIAVGRHMCAGHFKFHMKRTYKVRFTAYNFAGNSTADTDSKWIEFDSPYVWK